MISYKTRKELNMSRDVDAKSLDLVDEFRGSFGLTTNNHPILPAVFRAGELEELADVLADLDLVSARLQKLGCGDISQNARDVYVMLQLIVEETRELGDAVVAGDRVEGLDACVDLQYVVDDAFLYLGYGNVKDAAVAEVHRSNMSKLWPDGTPHLSEAGRVLKPESYSPPDLRALVWSPSQLAALEAAGFNPIRSGGDEEAGHGEAFVVDGVVP